MNRIPHSFSVVAPRQEGVVLVITLILLLVLTLVGLAATSSTSLEERMTGNQRDMQVAFQAAEAGLRDGESALQNSTLPAFDNSGGAYDATTDTSVSNWEDYARNLTWDDSNSVAYTAALDPKPSQPPRYFLLLTTLSGQSSGGSLASDQPPTTSTVYKVFARGVGLSGKTAVILESSYD
ncbi:MAG: pilus assembly PilX family protein [Gammaproteobacteria bacterium]